MLNATVRSQVHLNVKVKKLRIKGYPAPPHPTLQTTTSQKSYLLSEDIQIYLFLTIS